MVWRAVHEVLFVGDGTAGVRVAVEAREVAAGDLQPDAVALPEHVAGDAGVDGDPVDLAGVGQLGRSSESR